MPPACFLNAPTPLPLTFSTVEPKALFGVGISGSDAEAETILLTNRKRKSYVNVR